MKRLYIAAAALTFLLLGAYLLRDPGVAVAIYTVEPRPVREYIAEEGRTRLAETYLLDMPVGGTLERIALDVGDPVEADQVVAQVDPSPIEQEIAGLKALIAQARAQVEGVDVSKPKPEDLGSAEIRVREMEDNAAIARKSAAIADNDLEQAEREYRRAQRLHTDGALSARQFEEAERAYENAQSQAERARIAKDAAEKSLQLAGLAQARLDGSVDDNEYMRVAYEAEIASLEARLHTLEDNLGKTEIRAPVTGLVLEKYVDDRRVLGPGAPLLQIGDMASIEIESDILSEEVVRIREGQQVEISGKALQDRPLEGVVRRVYPSGFKKISSLGIEQQRVRILIAFDNGAVPLRPGTAVDIRVITAESEQALAVPESALFRYDEGWAVFEVRAGRAVLRTVEVGLKNEDWAELRSGLAAGALVIAEPKNDLADNAVVRVIEENEAAR